MQRLSTILLGVLAVLVFGAAIYVITDNSPAPVDGAQTDVSTGAPTTSAAASPSTPSTTSSARPSSSPGAKPVVAFLGDDWVAGSAATSKAKRFTTLVSARLGVTENNFGRKGSGYASGQTYDSRIADVVKAGPAVVVVVSGGRNDVLGSGAPSAATVATVFRDLHTALPAAKIVALTPMWGDSQSPQSLLDLAARVKAGVVAAGGTYLDVGDPLTGHADYMADTSNPNDAGYAAIAAVVAPALKPVI